MFFRSIPLFTILGFRVRLDLSWLLLALLVVTSTAQGFSGPPFSVGPAAAVALGLFFAFGLLMSIVLHELSHSLVARRHGLQIRGITLFILGGVAEMEEEPGNPWTEFLMAIAGPIASFLIAAACALGTWGMGAAGMPPAVVETAKNLAWMNLILGIFNLVPAFPLDGGRVFRAMLWGLKGDVIWATRIASFLGQAFGVVFGLAGVALGFMTGQWGYVTWVLIGFFLFRTAPMPYKILRVRRRLETSTVEPFVDPAPLVVPRVMSVADLLARVPDRTDDEVLAVADDERIVGVVSLAAARSVDFEDRALTAVAEVMARLPGDAVIHAATAAGDAIQRMQRLRLPALLVVDATRLVGIVRWHDLRRFAESA